MRSRTSLAIFSLTLLAACGSTVTDGAGGSGGQGGSGTGTTTTSDTTTTSTGTTSGCPASAPPDGAPCDPLGIVCEVEDGPIVECRAIAECTADGWLNEAPGCSSTPPEDPDCPMAMPTGKCDVATDPSICGYGDTLCGCSDCLGGPCGGQAQWVCGAPPDPPCPSVAPRLGAACADEGLVCLYGSCSLSAGLAGRNCTDGIWVSENVACPL